MLRARDITLRRGGNTLLDRLSFDLSGGEFVAVLGPNGAGKSSLRKTLTGEWADFKGDVTLDEEPLDRFSVEQLARRRAVLPQESRLSFPFTVEEVAELGRLPWQDALDPEADRAAVDDALEKVGLNLFRNRLFPTLSGGEKQRAHLARVFAQLDDRANRSIGPAATRFLFLDEPTNNLDLAGRNACLRLAREAARSGIGVFAILHDPNEALLFADRAVLLKGGRIAASGPVGEILRADLLSEVFGVALAVVESPHDGHRAFIIR